MTKKEHKEKHIELHRMLDELVGDYISHTGKLPSRTTVMELMNWANDQAMKPTEKK